MDKREQTKLRMGELQPEIPQWAKAEQMDVSLPQSALWNLNGEASGRMSNYARFCCVIKKLYKKMKSGL